MAALPEVPCSDTVLTDHFASGAATVDELLAGAMGGGESAADEGMQHPMAPVGHQGAVPWELQLPPGWGGMQGEPWVRESGFPCITGPQQRLMLKDNRLCNSQLVALSPSNSQLIHTNTALLMVKTLKYFCIRRFGGIPSPYTENPWLSRGSANEELMPGKGEGSRLWPIHGAHARPCQGLNVLTITPDPSLSRSRVLHLLSPFLGTCCQR